MFVALYRWRIKEGREARFHEGWHRRTEEIYRRCGSLGSRLHRAEDGTWVAYAQWPDKPAWEAARRVTAEDAEALAMMSESVEETLPTLHLEVVDDFLRAGTFDGRRGR